jgi:outer membrane protein assembly factor BamA
MKNKLTLLALLISFSVLGQRNDTKNTIKTDTLMTNKSFQFIGIPIVFFTPETGFAFGGGGMMFFLDKTNKYNNRLSNIMFTGVYTLNKQLMLGITPQIYLGEGNYFIDMSYTMEIFPNSFWGIGNNTPDSNEEIYNQTTHAVDISFLKRLPPDLNFGFQFTFKNHQITEIKEGGILDSGTILGSSRTVIAGLGAVFNLDSRDNTGSPTTGNYYQFRAQFSSEIFGATHGYNKFILNLRKYQPLGANSLIALQVYSESNFGDIPFQGLASYGGGTSARGYFFGRYIDKQMYVVQAEYRWRFKKRWTLAGFGLFGEVAEEPEDFFSIKNIKPSAGLGVRFKLFKDKDTWLRFDYGVGLEGNSGIYFGINESF